MFKSVLIANRGEIACRVMRTARTLGMRTIAVYSRADARALHVREADEAYEIGPAPAAQSYLRGDRILNIAQRAGAQCIHPGYGFLSENAEFAEACAAAGIVFIGPSPAAIRAMGLKDEAKALMRRAGVPVVPGFDGEGQGAEFLAGEAARIGYPVLIKAVAGGGGKGMRRVDRAQDFAEALAGARREAKNAFGNDRVLIEKYILSPRHIEVQVFGDTFGNIVHLFERDCSLQRRHQKVIEEAPAPGMSDEMRAAMGAAAVAAAKAVDYVGAGTVEFIVDGSQGLRPDRFWFMEMNTRLQVEHPVTEAITGLDLVELQFAVAAGVALPFQQHEFSIGGHAVEARLYAEDPAAGFLPSTGPIASLYLAAPGGVRVDAGVDEKGEVTPYYDPMIAKVIALGQTRDDALAMLEHALASSYVAGPRTNRDFLRNLLVSDGFVRGDFDTSYIEQHISVLAPPREAVNERAVALGALALLNTSRSAILESPLFARAGIYSRTPWDAGDSFQLSGPRRLAIAVDVGGEKHEVSIDWVNEDMHATFAHARETAHWEIEWVSRDRALMAYVRDGVSYVLQGGEQTEVRLYDSSRGGSGDVGADSGIVISPMHGKVVAIFVSSGENVERGQRVAIVEAMKMEHVLVAPRAGAVGDILVKAGQQVAQGARMLVVGD
jgi:3-methylcrotonyl-CoA carboxylase alpha subunit